MGISFTAIDFETANNVRGSVCAVGLVKVTDGVITGKYSTLIRPPEGLDEFHPINVEIHGITAADVTNAPPWSQVLPEILEFAGDDVLVAHNAAFDMGALREACDWTGLEYPDVKYMCTLVMSRAVYDFPVLKLNWLVHELGLGSFQHHDAAADARACAQICLDIAERMESATMDELAEATVTIMGAISSEGWRGATKRRTYAPSPGGSRRRSASLKASDVEVNAEADPGGALYGEVVCFTGKLQTMGRKEAWAMVGSRGGTPVGGVTKKTTILVNADFDSATIRPDNEYTNKMRDTINLAREGQRIEIVNEKEFLEMLAASDEELAQAARMAGPTRTILPDHVTSKSRELNQANMDVFAWQDAVLKHPQGRATAGDICCYCAVTIPEKVPWKILDRGLCGSRCNQLMMRAAKRLWRREEIHVLSDPSQAEDGFLVSGDFPLKRTAAPRYLGTRGPGGFPYDFDRYPVTGDVIERHGHHSEYMELRDPRLPAGATAYGRELAQQLDLDPDFMVGIGHVNSGAVGYAKVSRNRTPDRVFIPRVFLDGNVLQLNPGRPISGTGTALDGLYFHTEFISDVEGETRYRWEAQVWTPVPLAPLWTPERMTVSSSSGKRKKQMAASYTARRAAAGETGDGLWLEEVYAVYGWNCHFCEQKIDSKLIWPNPSTASLGVAALPMNGMLNVQDLRPAHWACVIDEGSTGTRPRILSRT